MPLIIAVLIIIFVFIKAKEDRIKNDKDAATWTKSSRKTNAKKERRLVDIYMKHGYSFEDAFRKSYEDMVAEGYDPCIPKNAYTKNQNGVQSSYCKNPESFDSFCVQHRRDIAIHKWRETHGREPMPDDVLEAQVYDKFPTTHAGYLYDLKAQSFKLATIPVGEFLIYPGLGTCEVIGHNHTGGLSGTYVLRVLSTGDVVSNVKIGDSKISRQGKY